MSGPDSAAKRASERAAEKRTRRPGQTLACGWCGTAIVVRATGRTPKWCSDSCRHRAWETSRAAAAGRLAVKIVDRIVEVEAPVTVIETVEIPALPKGAGWVGALHELARARSAPGRSTTATCPPSPSPSTPSSPRCPDAPHYAATAENFRRNETCRSWDARRVAVVDHEKAWGSWSAVREPAAGVGEPADRRMDTCVFTVVNFLGGGGLDPWWLAHVGPPSGQRRRS